MDSYYRGAELEPEQRLKLFKLIWDATGSEFGARHAVYESHYSGNAEQIRLDSRPGPAVAGTWPTARRWSSAAWPTTTSTAGYGGPRQHD
ncbi:4-hydroxyphenylacetate 3-hydroxylase C-terminal domain-containing protein [Pseudomonas aeruginosa]|nr:4-hydroxyphenylacetate 3-hydroxylase C-terminal domain-containing protein [Pseudomonas aeruginosa]